MIAYRNNPARLFPQYYRLIKLSENLLALCAQLSPAPGLRTLTSAIARLSKVILQHREHLVLE